MGGVVVGPARIMQYHAGMRRVLGVVIASVGWIAAAGLGLYIYVGSILGAHYDSGIVAAIATAVLPPFAQIYWLIVNWTASGTITSPYSLACMAWIAAIGMIIVGRAILPDQRALA